MNWDEIAGNWKQFTGQIKEHWGKLTDDDITRAAGRHDRLCGLLQKHYGRTREQAEKDIEDFAHSLTLRV
jgi:uncharacterized protein YjbJ (UPF0337 family)